MRILAESRSRWGDGRLLYANFDTRSLSRSVHVSHPRCRAIVGGNSRLGIIGESRGNGYIYIRTHTRIRISIRIYTFFRQQARTKRLELPRLFRVSCPLRFITFLFIDSTNATFCRVLGNQPVSPSAAPATLHHPLSFITNHTPRHVPQHRCYPFVSSVQARGLDRRSTAISSRRNFVPPYTSA